MTEPSTVAATAGPTTSQDAHEREEVRPAALDASGKPQQGKEDLASAPSRARTPSVSVDPGIVTSGEPVARESITVEDGAKSPIREVRPKTLGTGQLVHARPGSQLAEVAVDHGAQRAPITAAPENTLSREADQTIIRGCQAPLTSNSPDRGPISAPIAGQKHPSKGHAQTPPSAREQPRRLMVREDYHDGGEAAPRGEGAVERKWHPDTLLRDIIPHEGTRPTSSVTTTRQGREVFVQEYILDHVVTHRYNGNGVLEYRSRWYGYDPSWDTWEPIEHLPRSKVVQYHRRAGTATPATLCNAQVG